jgi:hypothetical protein
MKVSKLNVAVFVQLAGFIMLMMVRNNIVRVIGVFVLIVGGVLYRREQKRLKALPPGNDHQEQV